MQAASDIFEDMPHELVESVTEERQAEPEDHIPTYASPSLG